MPRRGNPFQSLVRELHRDASETAVVRESGGLTDRITGQFREVDILIELHVHGYPIVIAVECTMKSRPASVTWVEEMLQKHADLPTDKLVLVSGSGFTSTAAAKARAKNVPILHLQDLEDHAWTTVVGKQEQLVLESVRARIGVSVISEPDENWPGQLLSRADVLRRGDLDVRVARLIDAVLAQPELMEVALRISSGAEGEGCTIQLQPAPGIFAIRSDGESIPVLDLLVVFIPSIRRDTIQLRSGVMGDAAVAFGGVRDKSGRELDISLVEHPHTGLRATWTERIPGELPRVGQLADTLLPCLSPAPQDDIRRLLAKE